MCVETKWITICFNYVVVDGFGSLHPWIIWCKPLDYLLLCVGLSVEALRSNAVVRSSILTHKKLYVTQGSLKVENIAGEAGQNTHKRPW